MPSHTESPGAKYFRMLGWLAIATTLVRLLCIARLPITLDEAYYASWSHHLSWGYLDHPPMVALLGVLTKWWQTAFAARVLGTVAVSIGAWSIARTALLIAPTRPVVAFIAFAMSQCSFGGFSSGILLNPDSAMVAAWSVGIHEFVMVLQGQPRRWMTAGLACGVAILSKYIGVLLPISMIICLAWRRPKELKNSWFLAGVLVAVLAGLPHLRWNATHDWATVSFQINRGFTGAHIGKSAESNLPPQVELAAGSPEKRIADYFDKATEAVKPPPKAPSLIPRPIVSIFEFISGQLALWGLFAIPVLIFLSRDLRSKENWQKSPALSFLAIVTVVPLAFFGLVSLGTKVEANWAGVHMLSASILIASITNVRILWFAVMSIIQLGLFLSFGACPSTMAKVLKVDRIFDETAGYEELLESIPNQSPVFADTYQTVSMLRFRSGSSDYFQWPGLARVSEFVRQTIPEEVTGNVQRAGFSLVLNGTTPRQFANFQAKDATLLVVCRGGNVQKIELDSGKVLDEGCGKILKRWLVLNYQPTS